VAGADHLGLFALVMSVYYLTLAVQESLITVPYTIFRARLKDDRQLQYSGACLCQSAAWAVCVGAILAVVALWMSLIRRDGDYARVVAAFALAAPLWLLREFVRRHLFAHMQLMTVIVMSVAGAAAQFIALGVLVLMHRLSAASAICAMGFGSGIVAFVWLWFNRRAFHCNGVRSSYFLLKNWVLGRWILASQATAVVATSIGPWLILFWLGPTATGIFAACDSILRAANPMIISLTNVLTPQTAIGFSDGGKPALRRIVWKATALLSLFLFAFCLLLAIAGEFILQRGFGESYAAYWAVLVVLGLNQLVARIALAPGRALLLLERANVILCAEIAGLVTSLIVAFVLIPRFGVMGAALSLLAGNVPFTLLTVWAYLVAMRDANPRSSLPISHAAVATATAGGASE
jgi:O-antigen/teichoic acid export membrane protein